MALPLGIRLQATGAALQGGNPQPIIQNYKDGLEEQRRKAAIDSLMGKMGIGGNERALLATMPAGAVQSYLLQKMQPKPGRAPTQAELQAAQDARLAQVFAGSGVPPRPSGGFSMGTPQSMAVTSPQAMGGGLSFGADVEAQPLPDTPVPSQPTDLGFSTASQPARIDPAMSRVTEAQRKYDLAVQLMDRGVPGADRYVDRYREQLEFEMERAKPADGAEYKVVGNKLLRIKGDEVTEVGSGETNTGRVVRDAQGNVIYAEGSPETVEKFTEAQSKDNVYATRATGALDILDPIADNLTNRWERLAELDPTGLAREMQSDEFQIAKQAGDEFLQAILRKDTGAAITEPEQFLYGRTYLPQPGDKPAVLNAKKAARSRAIAALKSGMSPAQILATERALGDVVVPETETPAQAVTETIRNEVRSYTDMSLNDLLQLDVNSLSVEDLDAVEKRFKELQK